MFERIYELLGQYDGFYTRPPLDERKIYLHEGTESTDLAMYLNDGHEVWLGLADQWHWHYKRSDFWKIVRWFLWNEIFINWCGFRTFIWFKMLHYNCEKTLKMGRQMRGEDASAPMNDS